MSSDAVSRNPEDTRWVLRAILPLFFLSGACGLLYQSLWLRLVGLIFGVTVYAASVVWASFMAGLAIGSVLGGRLADRVAKPLVWFGLAEMLIGVTALATPQALDWLQGMYVAMHPHLPESLMVATGVRAVMSFALLIVPTVLMGATLPLVVRSSLFRSDRLGGHVGLLYGSNTAGAVLGTLVTGLYMIPELGIRQTLAIGAATNVAVGAVALIAGMLAVPRSPARALEEPVAERSGGAGVSPRRVRVLVLWVFALSGLSTLALEVVWFRVIAMVVRTTVYGFAVMLATVLLGIALGSLLATPLMRRRWNWVAVLAGLELAMGVTALFSFATLSAVPAMDRWASPYIATVLPAYLSFPIVAAIPAILPTTLLMGVAFPIGLRVWAGRSAAHTASDIGTFYSLNVCGSIVGSILAGFVLLPALTSLGALVAVAGLFFASGLALLVVPSPTWRRLVLAGVLAAGFVALAVRVPDPFLAFLEVRFPTDRVVWREESVQATVSVHEHQSGTLGLYLEGNHQASDIPSTVFVHRRIGHTAMAVHPNPEDVLVVGLGGGATAGAVAIHPSANVDVVELSESVVRGSRFFRHVNHGVQGRRNVRIHVDDGRNFLLLTPRKYDVITGDVILPIHAGSNNLYSVEYFRLQRRALKPGGIVTQWVWGTEAEFKIILRTFLRVFPNSTLWGGGSLLLGSVDPLVIRRADLERKLEDPAGRQALSELGVDSLESLLGQYVAGPDELHAFVGRGTILTDDRPLVEYFLSLPRDRDIDLAGVTGDPWRHVVQ